MEKRISVIALLILSLLFALLFTTVLVTTFYFYSKEDEPKFLNIPSKYQYSEINHATKSTKYGLVQIPFTLEGEEYLSYRNDEVGSFFIITRTGGVEYECTGSCHCEGPKSIESVRRQGAVLSRGLFVLLSAFSVSMAITLAGKAFKEECVHEFSDTCDEDSITSEITECAEKKETSEEGKEKKFLCSGYCLPYEGLKILGEETYQVYERRAMEKFGLCEAMTLDRPVFIQDMGSDLEMMYSAKYYFGRDHLTPFCMYGSSLGLLEESREYWKLAMKMVISAKGIEPTLKKYVLDFQDTAPFCVAVQGRAQIKETQSINCVVQD